MSDMTLSAPETPVAPDTSTPAVETPQPTVAETMAAVWDKHNPTRAADGKFQGKDPVEPAADGAKPAEAGKEITDRPATAAPDQATAPAVEAPASWSAEMKAKLASLPPEHADIVRYATQRDKEQGEALSRMGQQVKQFEPIRGIIEQHAATFQKNGLAPADGISRMLAVEQFLETNPRAAIAEIARAYGVDLSGVQPATPADEHVSRLEAKVAQLEGKLTSREQSELQARDADLNRAIATTSKDLPHYEEVKSIIAGLLMSGEIPEGPVPEMLKTAYDRAVYAKPELRERLQKEQRAAEEAKAKEVREKAAGQARKDASINPRSNGGASPATPMTVRETMAAVYDKRHGAT